MNIKLQSIINELEELRGGIPQFLFNMHVSIHSTISVRNEVINHKSLFPHTDEIDFILESPGGSADDAYRIIRTLRKNFKTVNVIVPFWAKSAATLLALGASRIIMDEFAEFGALDVQLQKEGQEDDPDGERESALVDEVSLERLEMRAQQLFLSLFTNIRRTRDINFNKTELALMLSEYVTSFYKPLLEQVNPYRIGDKRRKLDIGAKYADRILVQFNNINDDKKYRFIDYLVNECPHHGYIVDYDVMSQFLPNVIQSSEISELYCMKLRELSSYFLGFEETSADRVVKFVYKNPETNKNVKKTVNNKRNKNR